MSPRSSVVVSAAYYGMLYAARAALSERGEYAKTHSGTWTLFSQVFVAPGEFDQRPSALARRAKDAREQGDYEAAPPTAGEDGRICRGRRRVHRRDREAACHIVVPPPRQKSNRVARVESGAVSLTR